MVRQIFQSTASLTGGRDFLHLEVTGGSATVG
jgi:hypothetical protein